MPVYTKPDGRIACVYLDENGKRIWEYFGRGDKAREAAEERDLEIRLFKKRGPRNRAYSGGYGSNLTFRELADLYVEARASELSAKTLDEIIYTFLAYFHPKVGDKLLHRITMDDARRIQQRMIRKKISNRSINTYFHYAKKMLDWAADDMGYLQANPWGRRKNLRNAKKFKIELFQLKEFLKIKENALPHLAWCMEVAYYTGVRTGKSELFALRWEDVEWKRRRIRIYATKTDHWRWQYLDEDFMAALRRRRKQDRKDFPDCPWICHYRGRQLKTVKKSWKKALTDAKITRRIRLYDIRHYYITYALASGADIMDLAERVGHVDGTMIMQVYAHLARDLKRNKAHKLPSLYRKNARPKSRTVAKTVAKKKKAASKKRLSD